MLRLTHPMCIPEGPPNDPRILGLPSSAVAADSNIPLLCVAEKANEETTLYWLLDGEVVDTSSILKPTKEIINDYSLDLSQYNQQSVKLACVMNDPHLPGQREDKGVINITPPTTPPALGLLGCSNSLSIHVLSQ